MGRDASEGLRNPLFCCRGRRWMLDVCASFFVFARAHGLLWRKTYLCTASSLTKRRVWQKNETKHPKGMKKLLTVVLAAVVLWACDNKPKFTVEGTVTGAEGKTLYLEASALEGIVPLDSAKLKGNGSYRFRCDRPEMPEFYRLRIDGKTINFAVDSTETVVIDAPYEGFATQYAVGGSEQNGKIKDLTLRLADLQGRADRLVRAMQGNAMGAGIYQDSLSAMIGRYKDEVRRNYIYAAPNTTSAYYALFQRLNGFLLFDPLNDRDDLKSFAAVATSMNNRYPHADRSKNMYNIVIKGMQNTRIQQLQQQQQADAVAEEPLEEAGLIDLNLRDLEGNVHTLSGLKGKVVVLDFTVYQSSVSTAHNYLLLDLYKRYADRGLEIYQVSLDADEHFWKTTADNLPWVCVRDPEGIYSPRAASYNVQGVPTVYVIDRNNDLNARVVEMDKLGQAVEKLL